MLSRTKEKQERAKVFYADEYIHNCRVIHGSMNYPEFDFHSLRHTHCSMLLEAGAAPKYVQERLGHKNLQVTMNIYQHLTPKMSESGNAILNALY